MPDRQVDPAELRAFLRAAGIEVCNVADGD
jgi:hypothetical protein